MAAKTGTLKKNSRMLTSWTRREKGGESCSRGKTKWAVSSPEQRG